MRAGLILTVVACVIAGGCGYVATPAVQAQTTSNPNAILSGHYVFQSQGSIWQSEVINGVPTYPAFVPNYIPATLFDSGTMEADGEGHIAQCGSGVYGTYTAPMNCDTHWTMQMGVSDNGVAVGSRFGWGKSNVGDIATITCTETGKICILTAHNVGWAWSARMERE